MTGSRTDRQAATDAGHVAVYVVHGVDELLRDEAVAEIRHSVVDDPDDPGGCTAFDARSSLADVLDDLRTLPMLSRHRLVMVHDADDFIKLHRAALEQYCQAPSPTACLLLICKSFPSNTRLYRAVRSSGVIRSCDPPKGAAMIGWIIRQAEQAHGKPIERPAAAQLQRLIGDDLLALDCELEKLALYVGERPAIRAVDVEHLVGLRREERVFGIADAIVHADTDRALTLWDQVWSTDRAAPARAIGGLAWALRRYLEARAQLAAGGSVAGFARQFWTSEADLRTRLSRQPLEFFEDHLRSLQEADAGVKVGVHDAYSAVEKLIVARCTAGK